MNGDITPVAPSTVDGATPGEDAVGDVYDQRDAAEIRAEFAERDLANLRGQLAAYKRLEAAAQAWRRMPRSGAVLGGYDQPLAAAVDALEVAQLAFLGELGEDNILARVLREVAAERARQDEKWGEQNHPLIDQTLVAQGRPHTRFAEEYEIPTAMRATQLCQLAGQRGEDDWLRILVEEVSEFMAAAEDASYGPEAWAAARSELIQVAAVAVAAIESMDRRSR